MLRRSFYSLWISVLFCDNVCATTKQKIAIENTNNYIIGEHSLHTAPEYMGLTGPSNRYYVGSGTYYDDEYKRGEFIETCIKTGQ